MPILLNKTLRLFLDSIGRRDEYEYYLSRFKAVQAGSFALVLPDREGFEEAASVIAFDLEFLVRLGLDPLIVLTGTAAEAMAGMLGEHSGLLTVVTPDPAGELPAQVFAVQAQSRAAGRIAVLVCPSLDRLAALQALVPVVSRRVHVIRLEGALRDEKGTALAYYDAARPERVPLAASDRELATLAGRVLALSPGIHLSVASPLNLLEELFTVKGAGCVVRLGAEIVRIDSTDGLDRERLAALLGESFNRPLRSMACLDRIDTAYIERNYHGAALLERFAAGMYLSKFAVGKAARGEGLAQELWGEVTRDWPAMFWRARLANPVHQWYERHADGFHRQGLWRIYWRGIDPGRIPDVIATAQSRPDDFE